MQSSLSTIDLVLRASFFVQLILLLLFSLSVGSWAIILLKRRLLLQAQAQNEGFLNGFWGGWNLSESFGRAADYPLSPVARCFQAAIREVRKMGEKSEGGDKDTKKLRGDIVLRTLRKSNALELATLEHSLSFLATVASSAPFIGLFGTVWGIMHSFQAIGSAGSASLATVAPSISEALIATALGLAAAIPAAVAYNYLLARIRQQALALDSFNQDLLNLLQREGII